MVLPAIPPWQGSFIVPAEVSLKAGDEVIVKMTWRGEKSGIFVEIDVEHKEDP